MKTEATYQYWLHVAVYLTSNFLSRHLIGPLVFPVNSLNDFEVDLYLQNVVPIVMGGANYSTVAPPHSYINVADFTSPHELATFLLKVIEPTYR
jgi:hypothetical protein